MMSMRVLLVESTPGNGAGTAAWLQRNGHETATCFDPPHGLACRGVENHDDCPLSRHADLAVLVSDLDSGTRTLTEMGAVCALRHRVRLVELVEPDDAELDAELDAIIGNAADDALGYEWAVEAALSEDTTVQVTRSSDRVHVQLGLAPGTPRERVPMIVDRANRAVRAYDPFVKVIDVAVM